MVMPGSPVPKDAVSDRDRKFREQVFRHIEYTGSVKVWPTATAPEGWVNCAGGAISRVAYKGLFDLIGTAYGVGDGSTTFNVPDWAADAPAGGIYIIKV